MGRVAVPEASGHAATVERSGDRELVLVRMFGAPSHAVYRAWSRPELFRRWWLPRSITGMTLVSCDMDVRIGGRYRLGFGSGGDDAVPFHGDYLDVVPDERIVWTNDEGGEGAITTVTFKYRDGRTLLTFHEAYPFGEALEEALRGSAAGLTEQLDQLGELLGDPAG